MANSYDINLTVGSSVGFKQVGGLIEGDVPIIETVKGFNDATSSTAQAWVGNAEILYIDPVQVFGILVNNTSSIQNVKLTNFGDATIELYDIYFSDHPSVQHITNYTSATAVTIAPGNTYTFQLSYFSSEVGEYTSVLIVDSNNTAGPYRVITQQFVEDRFAFRVSPVNISKTVNFYGQIQKENVSIIPAGGIVDEISVITVDPGFYVRNLTTSSFSFEFDPDNVNNLNGTYVGTASVFANSIKNNIGDILAINLPVAAPVELILANHGLTTGTRILVENVQGTVELNGNYFYVDILDPSTLALYTDFDAGSLIGPIDGSTYSSYISGGNVLKREGGTLDVTMTVDINLGTFLGYDSSGRSIYQNWRSYGSWIGTASYYDSIVGLSLNRINGRKYLTIGMGSTGTNESIVYTSGGKDFISINDLGIAGSQAVPPFAYWNTVFHIPLNADGDTVPRVYFSGDYKVKTGIQDYSKYFGDYGSLGSPFIVEDNGKNTVLIKMNHLRELSGDEEIDVTLQNFTRAFYYYQGREQPGPEVTGNLDPEPINSTEDSIGTGAYTKKFIGFYINQNRTNTATVMTSIVSIP